MQQSNVTKLMQRRSSDLRSFVEARSVCMRKEEALEEEARFESATTNTTAAANGTSLTTKISIPEVPMKENVDVVKVKTMG
jgi:hypothetical protein